VTRDELSRWVEAYEAAWRSPGTEALDALFAADATYQTAPFEPPYVGPDAIRAFWDAERDGPDEVFTMEYGIVAVEGPTGVVRTEVSYGDPVQRVYRDLWVVTLGEDERCTAFEEWPFWPRGTAGTYAPGPRADNSAR
jgi:hypothetical protein